MLNSKIYSHNDIYLFLYQPIYNFFKNKNTNQIYNPL